MLNTVNNQSENKHADSNAPVGVFDSGIGGLSVLKHLREHLPLENFLYVADTAYAPYGERSNEELIARSIKITEFFLQQGVKALVIACNTATAAAVATLRERYPTLIIIGMEPGIKPAAARSASKIVGVLATRSTLQSEKFNRLSEQLGHETQTQFIPQACVGLVNQIEQGDLKSKEILSLLYTYVTPLLKQGVDTLVLGCTHYPFVESQIRQVIHEFQTEHQIVNKQIFIIDTGAAIAHRLANLLQQRQLLNQSTNSALAAWSTGKVVTLNLALAFSGLASKNETAQFLDL
ncbi:glutamate racemase [Undibacterium flavidum]|uniref:Glutamate racemase n=1 Tax=Undibacterium flavidum TaxID=2762297 RepID=A0ABR6Y5Q7_9BURK|nr:glutamate racemase [Undibacterium flavidum]MBC3871964.1 glutamate racemase [Undibacterium flavidum]